MKNLVFRWKTLNFDFKNPTFQIKSFEILGFSHMECEALFISGEIPNILKNVRDPIRHCSK